ncbi:DUF1236 domain-containing protein [Ensifer sp.]|uniref:DUF1236 domain-containing protein n=1 Tax=Ensifer sp. TaxID=1872086 RepID=UPI0028A14A42|nr:DUF1236 domain-containing protein [Ensifer sp.]
MRLLSAALFALSLPIALPAFAQSTTTVVLPGEVRTYVLQQQTPSVVYDGEVVVGQPLPGSVKLYRVPDQDYSYTILNDRRVIIDPRTHAVIEVLE